TFTPSCAAAVAQEMTVKQRIEISVFIVAALYLTYRDQAKLLTCSRLLIAISLQPTMPIASFLSARRIEGCECTFIPFQIARAGADKNATDVRNLCDPPVDSTHERNEHRESERLV